VYSCGYRKHRATLSETEACIASVERRKDVENILYYGDNLDIMRRYVKDESVDLIYLDPPFNSSQNYNVLFKEQECRERFGEAVQHEADRAEPLFFYITLQTSLFMNKFVKSGKRLKI